MTLFQGTLNSTEQSLIWQSPFTGYIDLSTTLGTVDQLTFQILLDGKDILGNLDIQNTNQTNGQASGETSWDSYLKVKQGSIIEFLVTPKDPSQNYTFNVDTKISTEAGLVFLSTGTNSSFDHVGFFDGTNIYESSPAYTQPCYWDIFAQDCIAVNSQSGVQSTHTLGTFLHLSSDPNSSPVQNREIVRFSDIPYVSENQVELMLAYIQSQENRPYVSSDVNVTPVRQKGYDFRRVFSGIGLIERAAEQAGIFNGQGFIFNHLELIHVNGSQPASQVPWECLSVFPTTIECRSDYELRNPLQIPTLSSGFLHYLLNHYFSNNSDTLQGLFQNVEFLLTDPLGRRLGYTEEFGLFEEIPNAFYDRGEGKQHFFIPERLEGQYVIDFFGLCNADALAILGDASNGSLISGCQETPKERIDYWDKIVRGPSEDNSNKASTPEPSSLLSLLVLGAVFMGTGQQFFQRHNERKF